MEKSEYWKKLNVDELNDNEYEVAEHLDTMSDFMVIGNALEWISDMAKHAGYRVIHVDLDNFDVLRGTPKIMESESGVSYYERIIPWQEEMNLYPEDKHLIIFSIDKADPKWVNALSSFIGKHGAKYFVCVLTNNTDYNPKNTLIYDLVKPVIIW